MSDNDLSDDEPTNPGGAARDILRHAEAVRIARVCHEANSAYAAYLGEPPRHDWERSSKDLQDSAVNGVLFVLNRPDVTPEELHAEWCDARTEAGWRWGPIRDDERKIHPCLVPYAELPREQQTKDRLFRAIVLALAEE